MTKRVPKKTINKTRRTDEDILKNETFKKALEKAGMTGARVARKNDKVQRAAKLAMAETVDDWLDWSAEDDASAPTDFFVQIALLASAANRSKILKHAMIPQEAIKIIEAQVAQWKAEGEKEAASKDAAKAEADPFD